MGWSAQYFTTIIIEGNTPLTGIFIYAGTPQSGTLIGSWAAQAGQDAFGNTYTAGLDVNQGNLAGVNIENSAATALTIMASVFGSGTINNSQINQGQILETTIIFDSSGGALFGYTSSTTTVTQTVAGNYTFTSPIDGTASVTCIGAGAGGDGGNSSEGGNGGGGGECGKEPTYPLVNAQVYPYTVGAGGNNSSTSGGHGGDGGDSFFDINNGGVIGHGGNGDGTPGSGSTNTVHHNGGSGGASNGNTGGASGGNSANATAAGNSGTAPTGSSGAPSPSAQSGSGTGGAGGNSGANGSNGGSPGAGGGGAGAGSSVTTKSISYAPTWNASYYGPDSGSPNNVRSTSTMYQGGETASGGSFNGNQRNVFAFNRTQIASDFAGYTITGCQVQFRNLHSWYNSGMYIELDEFQGLPGSHPSTYPDGDYRSADASLFIAEGATTVFNIATSIAQRFVTGSSNGLGMGRNIAADHPYNLNYYGYFDPSQTRFKITGTIGGGTTNSGTGADGSVVITYASSTAMVMALSAVAGSDANGNSFGVGYTGPTQAFDPSASPATPETWHNIGTLSNGWTYQSDNLGRYKLLSDNRVMVEMHVNDSSATSGTPFTMPVNYRPAVSQFVQIGIISGVTADSVATIQITTGGAFNVLNWAKQSKQYAGNVIYSLD